MTVQFIALLFAAYLLGSIPFAYLIAHHVGGMDIRRAGDGNPGGKNVYHHVGPRAGVAATLLDVGKGAVALLLARSLGWSDLALLWVGVAVVAGHDWSLFLHFQGGQGMATTIGVFLVLLPAETLVSLGILAAMLWLTRNWDLACGTGLASLPVLAWWTGRPSDLIVYVIALLPLIGIRKLMQNKSRAAIPKHSGI
ncbi:MAG TPA: glycerol-3-phosphate acyltransferase [Anaerolineae bacterium]